VFPVHPTPERTDLRITFHDVDGQGRIQWTRSLLRFSSSGVPSQVLLDYGVVDREIVGSDLWEALLRVLSVAAHHDA
jgi:hypothetical protein